MNASGLHRNQTRYAAAWKPLGTGIIVALMFLIQAAFIRSNEAPVTPENAATPENLNILNSMVDSRSFRSIEMQIPLSSLRDENGRLSANSQSFFLLLARRMQTLQLNVKLTINSNSGSRIADTSLAATIASQMMTATRLQPTQLCISCISDTDLKDTAAPVLTVTISQLQSSAN